MHLNFEAILLYQKSLMYKSRHKLFSKPSKIPKLLKFFFASYQMNAYRANLRTLPHIFGSRYITYTGSEIEKSNIGHF